MPSPSRLPDMINSSAAGRARRRKPLTERERAAKAERIAAYEARCAALKAGTFKGVVEAAAEAKARSEAERRAEEDNARKMVSAHMGHAVYGQRLTRFIGNRPGADACRLANVVIPNWLKTQGIVVDHVAPTT